MTNWGKPNPKKEGWYLCTVKVGFSHCRSVMPLYRGEYPPGNWIWTGLNHGEVVAAIKFPKPYEGE